MASNTTNFYLFTQPSPTFSSLALGFSMALLFICAVGLIGNTLSLIIFLHPKFRQLSINVLLASLSASDFGLLVFAVPVFVSGPLMRYFRVWKTLQFVYTFSLAYLYPVTHMFHCCSIWLLAVVTVERWLAVCKPFLVAAYCNRNRSFRIILTVAFCSISINFVRFYEYGILNDQYIPTVNLRKDPTYLLWYSIIGNIFIVYFLPLVIMIFFNYRIAKELKRPRKRLSRVQKNDRITARMLFYVVLCFICCYTPCLILNVIEGIDLEIFGTQMAYVLSDFNNLSVLLNAATTFLFYLKFSSRYRRAAKLLITALFCHAEYYRMISTGKRNQLLYTLVNQSPSVSKSKLSVMYDQRKLTHQSVHSEERKLSEPSISQTLKPIVYPYRIVSVCSDISSNPRLFTQISRKRSAPINFQSNHPLLNERKTSTSIEIGF